jgi:hypothetical protein
MSEYFHLIEYHLQTMFKIHNKIKLIYFLCLVWLSHFIQVLVPETGFDAIWYHLPVVDSILENGKIIFSPDLYQSLNPLFSDLFFMIGYYFLGETGAKFIAYLFGLLLAFATYKLAKLFLNTQLSLGVTILVSTFQVIAWQSSSFYIDTAKAFWEVLAILFIIKSIDVEATKSYKIQLKIKSVLSFSASLATKLFSIFLLPVYIYIFTRSLEKEKKLKQFLILLLLFIFPIYFYINSYIATGNPFYSFSVHLEKLSEIGGQSSLLKYFVQRSVSLLISPLKLILSKDYTSPLLSILLIPLVLNLGKILKNKKTLILLIFSTIQWLLWWYLPPLSTRYALSGFITLLVLEIYVLKNYSWNILKCGRLKKHKKSTNKILVGLILFATINLLPRLFVNYRSLQYLLGSQTRKQYIEQFYDGSIDQKLKDWYGY